MDGGVGARAEGSVGWWQVAAQDQLRSARLYTQRRTPLVINSQRKYYYLLSPHTSLTFICSTVLLNNALTIQAQLVLHINLIVY